MGQLCHIQRHHGQLGELALCCCVPELWRWCQPVFGLVLESSSQLGKQGGTIVQKYQCHLQEVLLRGFFIPQCGVLCCSQPHHVGLACRFYVLLHPSVRRLVLSHLQRLLVLMKLHPCVRSVHLHAHCNVTLIVPQQSGFQDALWGTCELKGNPRCSDKLHITIWNSNACYVFFSNNICTM